MFAPTVILKKDVSVQTYDPITDEAPEFAARPPASRKKEMIPSISLFRDVDKKVLEVRPSHVSFSDSFITG